MEGTLRVTVVAVLMTVVMTVELVPTKVLPPPQRTQAPAEVVRAQYAQTLYKATDYSVCFSLSLSLSNGVRSTNILPLKLFGIHYY